MTNIWENRFNGSEEIRRGLVAEIHRQHAEIERLRTENAATIECCAQVAKEYIEGLTDSKSETMSHWDQIRGQVETYKGSDLPRLNFESLIETIAENTETVIRALKDKP